MATDTSLLTLRIVTPEKVVVEMAARSVRVPGEDGSFGVLPRHATMVALTDTGTLHVRDESNQEQLFLIHDGFAEVRDNVVTILSRSAELPDQIDLERAQRAAERAREHMRGQVADVDMVRATAALRRALLREKLARLGR
jgi:F-type H+-transporting ATPase subunit epsilon